MPKSTRTRATADARPAEAPAEVPAEETTLEIAAPRNCGCGCGRPTVTDRATFLAGHDARFAGQVGRGEIEPDVYQQAILDDSPALAAKVAGIRATQQKKAAAKAAREAAKVAAKEAYAKALAEAGA